MFFSAVVSLSLYFGVQAGYQLDAASTSQAIVPDLSLDSTCPLQAPFQLLSIAHQHSEVCSHDHHHPPQNTAIPSSIPEANPYSIYPACTEHTTEKFCVFTSTTVYNGRGVCIVTKPSIARVMARFLTFSSSLDNITASPNDNRDPPFILAPLPGKGLGMIASRTIERGDLIKVHPAIAIFHNDAVDKSSPQYPAHYAPLMKLAFDQLPSASRDLFLAMAAHNETEESYIERIYTNISGEDFGGEEHSIVILEAARLNHDCQPNVMYYFDPKTFTHFTNASRKIYPGEEITITYVDPLQTRLRRRAAIKRSWGFDCSCSLCSQSPQFVRGSSRRIQAITQLTKAFDNSSPLTRNVKGTPEMAELLISLYEQERSSATVVDAYRLAALSYSAVANEWMATKWAMQAIEVGLINDGPGDENVRDMMRSLGKPMAHTGAGGGLSSGKSRDRDC